MSRSLYESDFYGWVQHQVALLREGAWDAVDIENIIEEIESTGRGERQQLVHRLTVLMVHLLKWCFQSERRGRSWRLSVEEQRLRLERHMVMNPSLKPQLAEVVREAYSFAVIRARKETGMDKHVFPRLCPWSFNQMMKEDFWLELEGHEE